MEPLRYSSEIEPAKQSLCINIPVAAYDAINTKGHLPPQLCRAVASYVAAHGFSRLLLFGSSRTGQAIRPCLGERFRGFVDTASLAHADPDQADGILITTAPIHTKQVREALRKSPLAGLPVITLFASEKKNIRLILESQPRSGTDYTINNLRRTLNLGYASTYAFPEGRLSEDGRLTYGPEPGNGYIVKSHFTKPLHYPQYRYVPILFLIGFFPDTYYKWARMLAPQADRPGFRLTRNRPEWHIVRSYIPQHLQWLHYIADKTFIRFEDFHLDFNGVLGTLESLLGERPEGFIPPGPPARRLYWSDDFSRCLEPALQAELLERFAEPIRIFYPEKTYLLP